MQLVSEVVESTLDVSRAAGVAVELPVGFGEYAVFVDVLRRRGGLDWLSEVVLKRRAGAFELIDLVMFLGAYVASSKRGEAIVEFVRASVEYGNELVAIGDRRRWRS
jgi:hypothetical protein